MKNLIIDQQDCELSVRKDVLSVKQHGKKPINFPMCQLESIVIHCRMSISTSVLCRLAKHDIRVQFVSPSGYGTSCHLLGMPQKNIQRRLAQYQMMTHAQTGLLWAKRLIQIKRWQQKQTLLALMQCQNKHKRQLKKSISTLHGMYAPIQKATNLQSLLGLEGSAALVYLDAYKAVFSPKLAFTNRNRRPPKDPVNVILSLSYTLLYNMLTEQLYAKGLDTHLGFFHQPDYSRPSLACDLAEIFKPKIDLWIYHLFKEQLSAKDFSFHISDSFHTDDAKTKLPMASEKPCTLLKAGRKKYYEAFYALKPELEIQIRAVCAYVVNKIEQQVTNPTEQEDICVSSYATT